MDTTTGKILTPDEVEAEVEKAIFAPGKALELTRAKPWQGPGGIYKDDSGSPIPGMSMEEAMAKFLPDVKPLKKLPDPKCNHCYGLGNLGKNLTTGKYVPCSCTQ